MNNVRFLNSKKRKTLLPTQVENKQEVRLSILKQQVKIFEVAESTAGCA